MRCQILGGQGRYVNLCCSQSPPCSYEWECVDLFHGSLWEVVRVRSAGKLIPIEGGNDSSINGTLFKGIVQPTCRTRSAVGRAMRALSHLSRSRTRGRLSAFYLIRVFGALLSFRCRDHVQPRRTGKFS